MTSEINSSFMRWRYLVLAIVFPLTFQISTSGGGEENAASHLIQLSVGTEYLANASTSYSSRDSMTFLLSDITFSANGTATSFLAYFARNVTVRLEIWRPLVPENGQYELVGMKLFTPKSTDRVLEVILADNESIAVLNGDCLGFSNDGNVSAIGYTFSGGTKLFLSNSIMDSTQIGHSITFDNMPFPYRFALAATYRIESKELEQIQSTTRDPTYPSTDTSLPTIPESTIQHSSKVASLPSSEISTVPSTEFTRSTKESYPTSASTHEYVTDTSYHTTYARSYEATVQQSNFKFGSVTVDEVSSVSIGLSTEAAKTTQTQIKTEMINLIKTNSTTTKSITTTANPGNKTSEPKNHISEVVASINDSNNWLDDSRLVLALLIWLIIITVLFFFVCLCHALCWRRIWKKLSQLQYDPPQNNNNNGMAQQKIAINPHHIGSTQGNSPTAVASPGSASTTSPVVHGCVGCERCNEKDQTRRQSYGMSGMDREAKLEAGWS